VRSKTSGPNRKTVTKRVTLKADGRYLIYYERKMQVARRATT
jgi:hypothetical protein